MPRLRKGLKYEFRTGCSRSWPQSDKQVRRMFKMLQKFRADEDGAVTVDWVVITAAIVTLSVLVFAAVQAGTESLADKISSDVSAITIDTGS